MNVNMNSSTALTSVAGQSSGEASGVSLQRKAAQVEAQNTQTLVNSVASPGKSSVNLPSNLGQHVNTTA